MAKKMSSLAGDFEGISKAADSNVLALLNEDANQKVRATEPQPKNEKPHVSSLDSKSHTQKPKRPKAAKAKPPKIRKLEDWGKPVAHFNTRIPEEMSESLEDLVYKLRKRGIQRTKQDLAREALHDLLRKHAIC